VERRASAQDRRAKLVALTPAAAPLIAELDVAAEALRHDIMGELTVAEIEGALAVMRKLRARLQAEPAGASVRA
jgi:DNA-binding MarR family transcriptional regulator